MIARGEKMFAGNEPVSGTVRGAWRAKFREASFVKRIIDLSMSWNRLRYFGNGIVIPIMLSAMANQHAAIGFELTNEFFALH